MAIITQFVTVLMERTTSRSIPLRGHVSRAAAISHAWAGPGSEDRNPLNSSNRCARIRPWRAASCWRWPRGACSATGTPAPPAARRKGVSGRSAPAHPGGVPGLPDAVTREAYSHEVSSVGFWSGNEAGDRKVKAAPKSNAPGSPCPEKRFGTAERCGPPARALVGMHSRLTCRTRSSAPRLQERVSGRELHSASR